MLIPDRTYSTESCSTVTTTSNSQTHSNLHSSGFNWSAIGSGTFLSAKVYNGGTAGGGAQQTIQVLHNGEQVQINIGSVNLTNLNPGNTLTVRLVDSAGTVLASYTTLPGAMFYIVPMITFNATNYSRYHVRFIINNAGSGAWVGLSDFDISQDQVTQTEVCGDVDYRFGFNGMEKDNEVKGLGNSLDFGARIYDSRLGRWLSTDPRQIDFPAFSSYNFCLNNPIIFVDPDGKAPYPRHIRRALKMASKLHMGSVVIHPDGRVVVHHQNKDKVAGDLRGETAVHGYSIEIERTKTDKFIDNFSRLAGWVEGWDLFSKGDGHEVQFGIIITCHDRNGEGKNFGEEVTLASGAAFLMVPLQAFEAFAELDKQAQSSGWKNHKQTVTTRLNDQRDIGSKTKPKNVLDGKAEGLDELDEMDVIDDALAGPPYEPEERKLQKRTYITETPQGSETVITHNKPAPGSNGNDTTIINKRE